MGCCILVDQLMKCGAVSEQGEEHQAGWLAAQVCYDMLDYLYGLKSAGALRKGDPTAEKAIQVGTLSAFVY